MIVAGIDFGTESVRVAIVDHVRGVLGSASAPYPVLRRAGDPDFATQAHQAHLDALCDAVPRALREAGVAGDAVAALALDTTGSTVLVLGEGLHPLDDYYLWCDHRAKREADRLTEVAHAMRLPAITRCGGTYSSEWGFAKLLHWLREHPGRRDEVVAVAEHCDVIAGLLCGATRVEQLPRSVCAMGHKWMWSAAHGGLPPDEYLRRVDPLLGGAARWLAGRYGTSAERAGTLCAGWAGRLGLRAGIPVPVGALDAHWDAVGAGIAEGDMVCVIGTSTCIMAVAADAVDVPGVSGVVPGSIHPGRVGIEAGLSASGQLFDAIARRAGQSVDALSRRTAAYRVGQTGLLRLAWDNGDRSVLVNPWLGGITLGWTVAHEAHDELFAAIEGTALHTRVIVERLQAHGVPVRRLIHGGGIPQQNEGLNRTYATILGMPVLVPERPVTGLGAAIFALVAAGAYPTVEAAQRALCPPYREVAPAADQRETADALFALFRAVYFGLGTREAAPAALGHVLPALGALARGAPPAS